MQRDGDAVGRDVDPFDQQPEDARLFDRVELVPDRLESAQRLDDSPSVGGSSTALSP
jgi:hypothetical protein